MGLESMAIIESTVAINTVYESLTGELRSRSKRSKVTISTALVYSTLVILSLTVQPTSFPSFATFGQKARTKGDHLANTFHGSLFLLSWLRPA